MSTLGTALVVDLPGGEPFVPSEPLRSALVDGFVTEAPDGWTRTVALLSEVELVDAALESLGASGDGRMAIAEDDDEYGALWVVARAVGGEVEVVHRRYVLNADPDDPEAVEAAVEDLDEDPRELDVAGPDAARAAATLFGVSVDPVVDAEAESASAWEEIGVVGGPFPWWDALGLPWPVPAAGRPLAW